MVKRLMSSIQWSVNEEKLLECVNFYHNVIKNSSFNWMLIQYANKSTNRNKHIKYGWTLEFNNKDRDR